MFTTVRRLAAAVVLLALPLSAVAGAEGGAKYTSTQVVASGTDVFNVRFTGGSEASIVISGDGDTDLDLYVYDENGNLIASDTSSADAASVRWTPAWSGNFRVEVRNLGGVYNEYVVITN